MITKKHATGLKVIARALREKNRQQSPWLCHNLGDRRRVEWDDEVQQGGLATPQQNQHVHQRSSYALLSTLLKMLQIHERVNLWRLETKNIIYTYHRNDEIHTNQSFFPSPSKPLERTKFPHHQNYTNSGRMRCCCFYQAWNLSKSGLESWVSTIWWNLRWNLGQW